MINMNYKKFRDIDSDDNFFASLKNDHEGFKEWYNRINSDNAFILYDEDGSVEGFLYLNVENDIVDDIEPNIVADKILKVDTFKINPQDTRLIERFIKVVTDYAVSNDADLCYVTIFAKHEKLIQLAEKYGFVKHGTKGNGDKQEIVLTKDMRKTKNDIYLDYPRINKNNGKKFVLSISPKYHSSMFPDLILKTDDREILEDVSYTNSVNKIYVCSMNIAKRFKKGDVLVIYKPSEDKRTMDYTSIATSICVVDEIKLQEEFTSFDELYNYVTLYNMFDKDDLNENYQKGDLITIKMTYNIALEKRITKKDLIEEAGLNRFEYWGCFEIEDNEFEAILKLGNVNENYFTK